MSISSVVVRFFSLNLQLPTLVLIYTLFIWSSLKIRHLPSSNSNLYEGLLNTWLLVIIVDLAPLGPYILSPILHSPIVVYPLSVYSLVSNAKALAPKPLRYNSVPSALANSISASVFLFIVNICLNKSDLSILAARFLKKLLTPFSALSPTNAMNPTSPNPGNSPITAVYSTNHSINVLLALPLKLSITICLLSLKYLSANL